jgi:hypothetical protein
MARSKFMAQYDHLDVVFGDDHGARWFRAVVQLIFRSKNNGNVPTSSVTLQVGHIDAPKDTYEVLEETIARELNESLQRIFNKFLVIHFVRNHDPVVAFADEAPTQEHNNNWAAIVVRPFIFGD